MECPLLWLAHTGFWAEVLTHSSENLCHEYCSGEGALLRDHPGVHAKLYPQTLTLSARTLLSVPLIAPPCAPAKLLHADNTSYTVPSLPLVICFPDISWGITFISIFPIFPPSPMPFHGTWPVGSSQCVWVEGDPRSDLSFSQWGQTKDTWLMYICKPLGSR